MMMKAAPVAALVVAKAKFLLELLVIALDPPARLGHPHEALERGMPGQIGEPVLGRLSRILGPLDQQPLFRPGLGTLDIAMRWPHPHGSEARGRLALSSLTPADAAPGVGRQAQRQRLECHRLVLGIAAQPGRAPAAARPGERWQRPGAGRPDAGARAHAEHIAQAEVGNANAEGGLVTIGGVPSSGYSTGC